MMLNLHTKLIAECHFADCFCQSMPFHRIGRNHPSRTDIGLQFLIAVQQPLIDWQIAGIPLGPEHDNLTARFLKLRRDDIPVAGHIHCKGNQGRRHMDLSMLLIIESA